MNPHMKNYGFGEPLSYAVGTAIVDRFGSHCFGTQAAYRNRVKHLLTYLESVGIRDLREIDQPILDGFAREVYQKYETSLLAKSTATNILSVANIVINHVSGNASLGLRPRKIFGSRNRLRQEPPISMDWEPIYEANDLLTREGLPELGQLILLCRAFGLRVKEASLLRLEQALHQALQEGRINIQRGTKGGRGRYIDRWVPSSPLGKRVLEASAPIASKTGCLIPLVQSWKQWYQFAHRNWRRVAPRVGLSSEFRDLRAGWACERYLALTGHPAPICSGGSVVAASVDAAARQTIAYELGHARVDVVAAYVGGRGQGA